jgi:hypothetical protein
MREVKETEKQESRAKKIPRTTGSGAKTQDLRNAYCFTCGLALLAGVSFEPLWDFADMYIFLC